MPPIILASSSPYRRQLLEKLGVEFSSISPAIDESADEGESAEILTLRLAESKAKAIAQSHHKHLIIASDQVAALGNRLLSKPGNARNAITQLSQCSGNRVTFYTSLCVLNSESGQQQLCVEPFTVDFKPLTHQQIERYIDREKPYDCAGSFKVEGLGISLFQRLSGDDPNALVGLPLIRLIEMLAHEGIEIP